MGVSRAVINCLWALSRVAPDGTGVSKAVTDRLFEVAELNYARISSHQEFKRLAEALLLFRAKYDVSEFATSLMWHVMHMRNVVGEDVEWSRDDAASVG